MSTLTFDQVGISPGVADQARSDGLDTGAQVTVTADQAGTLQFLWVPIEDTDSVMTLSLVSPGVWTFNPTASVYGSYLLRFTPAGDPTDVTERVFSIRTPNAGLRKPALNEKALPSASLLNTGSTVIHRSQFNEPGSGPFGAGDFGGWYTALMELFDAVEAGGGGGGGPTLNGNVLFGEDQTLAVNTYYYGYMSVTGAFAPAAATVTYTLPVATEQGQFVEVELINFAAGTNYVFVPTGGQFMQSQEGQSGAWRVYGESYTRRKLRFYAIDLTATVFGALLWLVDESQETQQSKTITVTAAVTTALTTSYTVSNDGAENQTLTSDAPEALIIESEYFPDLEGSGYALEVGDLLLLTAESFENCGLYYVLNAGSESDSWVLLSLYGANQGTYMPQRYTSRDKYDVLKSGIYPTRRVFEQTDTGYVQAYPKIMPAQVAFGVIDNSTSPQVIAAGLSYFVSTAFGEVDLNLISNEGPPTWFGLRIGISVTGGDGTWPIVITGNGYSIQALDGTYDSSVTIEGAVAGTYIEWEFMGAAGPPTGGWRIVSVFFIGVP